MSQNGVYPEIEIEAYMIATKDIRTRIYNILDGITAVTGTTFTPAPRVPRSAQDFEGYLAVVHLLGAVSASSSTDNKTETQQWAIKIYTPSLGLGLDAIREDNLYDYRDLVLQSFCNKRNLQLSGVALANVIGATIISERLQIPIEEYGSYRGLWQATLELKVLRDKTC